MTPLQDFRIWLREASVAERATTFVAALVAVALFGWLVAPAGGNDSLGTDAAGGLGQPTGTQGGASAPGGTATGTGTTGTGTTGATGTGTVGTGTTGTTTTGTTTTGTGTTGNGTSQGGAIRSGSGTSGAGTGTSGTGSTSTGTSGGSCPGGTDQGVSTSRIDIAITLINITGAAGNAVFNVPTTTEQQGDWNLLLKSVNDAGGFGCRKVAATYYTINPLDANDAQNQCLKIAASKPFLALDTGALTNIGASDCIPVNKVPLISQYITQDQARKFFPYYISPTGIQEVGYHSYYLGAKQKGLFSAASGFKKLGIIFQSCRPGLVAAGRAAIKNAGIPDSQVVAYDLNCPTGRQTNPADSQQAVLTFKQQGVTHVTELDVNDFPSFTKTAAQQNFKPKYVVAEDAIAIQQSGAFAPDSGNLDGAVDVNGGRYGEQTTPGFKPSAGTARCNALFAKNGQTTVYQQGAGYGGVVCTYIWFLKALLDHTPQLARTSLVSGMHSIGALEGSYPFGPADFGAVSPNTPWGLEQWRAATFVGSCSCWRISNPAFNKAFP